MVLLINQTYDSSLNTRSQLIKSFWKKQIYMKIKPILTSLQIKYKNETFSK